MAVRASIKLEGCGLLGSCLIALIFGLLLAIGPNMKAPLAADYAPPILTAWQRPHEGRLAIEWAETIRVQQKREGDRLVLRFAQPLSVDPAATVQKLSNFVNVDRTDVDGKDFSLALKSGVVSKVTILEKRIVTVDFFRDPAGQPLSTINASTIENGIRLTFEWPGATQVETMRALNELRLKTFPARDVDPADLAHLQRTFKPWFSVLRPQQLEGSTTFAFVLEPQIAASVQPGESGRTIVELTRDASSLPTPAAGPARYIFTPKKKPKQRRIADQGLTGDWPPLPRKRPVLMAADDIGGDPPEALVIAWDRPTGAAIFIRAGYLWAVFDRARDGLRSASLALPSAFGPGTFTPVEGGTAIRFALKEPVNIEVAQTTEGHWRIRPVPSSIVPRPVKVERVAGSGVVRIMPASGERIVTFVDPTVGDRINVLPLRAHGFGQPVMRRFVDLQLLPTAQGLAWRALNDQLIANIRDDGLEFSSPGGLSLSETSDDMPTVVKAVAKKAQDTERPSELVVEQPVIKPAKAETGQGSDESKASYLELAGSGIDRQLVGETRRIRRQAISKVAPEERDRARLALARLLVSERLALEARTVLDTISDDAGEDVMLERQALLGASAFLIGHLAEASALLLDPDLSDDEEIELWRAALDSVEDNWQTAAERWQAASDILDIYPPRLKLDLGLMAVEAAIETNDERMMHEGFKRLTSLHLDAYDQARVDAMQALKAERTGDFERAHAVLMGLTESPHPTIRTLAEFQLAALDLAKNASQPDILAALDQRTPLWRGHPRERDMLDELARRFRDANALRKALSIWRRLIELYPEAAESEDLKKARRNTFVQALTNTAEPAIDPLDAYAIYLDFVDLLPDEPEARSIHRYLAQHLTDLDLSEQAIDILQSLMTSTADDLERAELGGEIAALMLRQNRAQPALSVLDQTAGSGTVLPPSLDNKRRLVRVRILAKIGRADEALRHLQDLQSQPARRLMAEILWEERRWPRLAATIEAYFADPEPTPLLAEDDQRLVLWLALARQREGTSDQLNALRRRFSKAMQDGVYAGAFDVATQDGMSTTDIKSLLAATESQIAEFRRFREASPAIP